MGTTGVNAASGARGPRARGQSLHEPWEGGWGSGRRPHKLSMPTPSRAHIKPHTHTHRAAREHACSYTQAIECTRMNN